MLNSTNSDQSTKLLRWYDRHHRILPWRVSPSEQTSGVKPDPYRVWLSEIMLQQTTVEAVKSYFMKFVKRWPTVQAMAKASEDDVLRAWAGLGYYSRARNLKKCADAVALRHNGKFPDNAIALKELPGIGDYTSAAIAAIAFGEATAVVDGNVERVISRLYTIDTPLPAAKAEIRALMGQMTPIDRPGDFAQAMMDLGATICTPRRPACAICPLNDDCLALKSRDPEEFPVKAPKAEKPIRTGAAFIAIAEDGSILLRKRKGEGLLAGMTEVPGSHWTARIDGDATIAAAPFAAQWNASGSITHVFTHFELRLSVYRSENVSKSASTDGWWSQPDDLSDEALPTVMKKAIIAAIPEAFKRREEKPLNSPVKHVVFDIGRVLIHYDPELAYLDVIPDASERRWFLENICTSAWNIEQDRGRSWQEAESLLIDTYPEKRDHIRAFRQNWNRMVPHAYEDSVEILRGLISHGNDVTMLTNFALDTFREAQIRFPFLAESRGVTVSGDIHMLKPDREIYDHHVASFDLDPAATLFIDDTMHNVDGARQAGWQAVHFTDAGKLGADLKALGLAF